MKKIIVGMILLISLVSCAEDEEIIIEKEHEKTKTIREVSRIGETSKESDSIKTLTPTKALEPGNNLDPGESLDPGEVGPVVTTPPK
ncbi:hypothetical protein [Chryseobacterium sp.]|uniref:hypothetical protein n=1 Tax=Chryseobacterium sp. TaxID=1871047 RepID=UPI00289EA611|nr:hypothetical protein [Chryseobacterium sp.]